MTKIIGGYAQPDIEATKGNETRLIFVETPNSMTKQWVNAMKKTIRWIKRYRPQAKVDLVVTKPKNL